MMHALLCYAQLGSREYDQTLGFHNKKIIKSTLPH